MRLIRLGADPSVISVDIRATLSSWGKGNALVGGVAVLGGTPTGAHRSVDAVIIRPSGLTLVVGVDLPDPALKLDAPLGRRWRVDGWLLTRNDESPNPAADAVELAKAVRERSYIVGAQNAPLTTVIAIGPYVEQVLQPEEDVARGFRALHPSPPSMLGALRASTQAPTPLRIDQVRQLLTALFPGQEKLAPEALGETELLAEGFVAEAGDAPTVALPQHIGLGAAPTASGVVVTEAAPVAALEHRGAGGPGVTPQAAPAAQAGPVAPAGRPNTVRPAPTGSRGVRGQLVLAAVIAAVVLGVMTVLVVDSSRGASSDTEPEHTEVVSADGIDFIVRGSDTTEDCAEHSYGDAAVWLAENPCTELTRGLYQAETPEAAIAASVLVFPDESAAADFDELVNGAGRGAVSDLVRDGQGWQGGPESFDNAAFVTARDGARLRIAQAVWLDEPSAPDDTELVELAETGLILTEG
ncbi:hypothetical protein [Actinoalloteichus hymeniacidonis]|uniref:Uncharacterized protein n=1 Tax=Actinoalloteichus hymeniacidonis TaxID=340345 RepID=A0AAC9HTR4_9PSEU|nr:hypothetical protein [Actinoalloteichus hymeniacidonis]AOS65230.1 hypothetical protein TL08_22240 [Actinoalloteichus hymeniacidonis]MBB5906690.1 hypothetical protein [Actinoalloteichus hymeniacidonis]